jgi:hypothetical protein
MHMHICMTACLHRHICEEKYNDPMIHNMHTIDTLISGGKVASNTLRCAGHAPVPPTLDPGVSM